jgi:hypothetical protein
MSSTQVSKPTGPLEKILVTGATSQQPIKEAEEVVEVGR